MKFRSFVLSLTGIGFMLSPSVNAEETDTKSKKYNIEVNLQLVQLKRDISGYTDTGKIDTSIDNTYKVGISALFFPETYKIKLGYTTNITPAYNSNVVNPAGFSSDADVIYFSAVPFFSNKYGGIGLGIIDGAMNGQFTNKTGGNLPFYTATSPTTATFSANIANNSTFKSKDVFSQTEISYIFPETSFLPSGFNISFTQAEREMVTFQTLNGSPVLVYVKGDSSMTGIGIVKDQMDLSDGFSLSKLKYSYGTLSTFADIDVTELSIAGTYKHKDFYINAGYSLFETTTQGFTVNTLTATMPKNTDSFLYIQAGMNF